ncbi:MAG TPA: hypothetical protein VF669_19500 [Tepidisphaeraceae bacterium]|jgi:Flp pilus assembly pilin Flp
MFRRFVAFVNDERATETLEWGLICGMIIVGAIAAITMIGPKVAQLWNGVNSAVQTIP